MTDETMQTPDDSTSTPSQQPAVERADAPAAGAAEPVTEEQVRMALRRVKDPELSLNIIDLGLVYNIMVDDRTVVVDMSLTSPGCPSGPEIMSAAEEAVRAIPGVDHAGINLVWTPMWTPERIEPRVRAYMGF